jgi:RimJ/RimL family protein N-acetyltransferase
VSVLLIFRLYVSFLAQNLASIIVLEKNYFILEGVLKNASFNHGKFYNKHLLARLKQ